ncbi:MAG: SCP2 sterol-binding domain-containing protein, partial [Myxococcales bacterium]|nr:SCP2 sterol-binding domain-containing protein [Myxococcales bacterium]
AALAPAVFAALGKRLADKPGLKDEVKAVVAFQITGPDAAWTVDCTAATPSVTEGAAAAADATLTLSDADLGRLAGGKATAKELFQHGALRVDGDIQVAHRLGFLKGLV